MPMIQKRVMWSVIIFGLCLSASGTPVMTLQIGQNPPLEFSSFIRDGESYFLPYQSSLERLGLQGYRDSSTGRLYIQAGGKLIVVDPAGRRAIVEQKEYQLAAGPKVWEDVVYAPSDLYTKVLADVLSQPITLSLKETPRKIDDPPAAAADPPAASPAARPEESAYRNRVNVIVLDPGHGGDETGAENKSGLQEKDVDLEIARRLKARLELDNGFTVLMTRNMDADVPLRRRPQIANSNQADLFISIHSNGSYGLSAHGFETYFLSLKASDEQAQKMADAENLIGLKGKEAAPYISDLELILGDMAHNEALKDSETFAMMIQDSMAQVMNSPNRGVKQAPFTVLCGLDMPGVLVEIGFITNPEEARKITSPKMQEKIVDAIYTSVVQYRDLVDRRLGNGMRKGAGK